MIVWPVINANEQNPIQRGKEDWGTKKSVGDRMLMQQTRCKQKYMRQKNGK